MRRGEDNISVGLSNVIPMKLPQITNTPAPEFVQVPQAVSMFGISRSAIYNLIGDGSIKSVCLRRRGNIRGTRLVSVDSMRSFLNSLPAT